MKTLFATFLALCSMALSANAQGTFIIDSSANTGSNPGPLATTGGLVYISPDTSAADGVLDTTQDINLRVLWGTSAGNVTTPLNIDPLGLNTGAGASSGNWLANQATGQEDITGYASGALLDINGNSYVVPGAAAGTTIFLVLQGWIGSEPTFASIHNSLDFVGQTAPFAITLAVNSNPVQPDVHNMGSLTLVQGPEPSIPAL